MANVQEQTTRVYYDPTARHRKGGWRAVTVLKRDSDGKAVLIDMPAFHTEAEARASIGLEGGNDDPAYRPGEDA